MAGLMAIHSVGQSLVTALRNAYPEPLRSDHPCEFRLISSGELAEPGEMGTAVTLYLYRLTADQHPLRVPVPQAARAAAGPLNLDLHYLLSVWSDSALAEHAILGWVTSRLHRHPILDRSSLSEDGEWQAGEQVQLVPETLSTEDMMRIWDALSPTYRLSVSYVARVVRIEPEPESRGRRVVATRTEYGPREDKNGG